MTRVGKSIVAPQNVTPTYLETTEKQLDMRSISPEQEHF